jgi:hypothetical protein
VIAGDESNGTIFGDGNGVIAGDDEGVVIGDEWDEDYDVFGVYLGDQDPLTGTPAEYRSL